MEKIKTAAEIRRDVTVLDRLNSCSNCSYHLGNKCNKTYTHKRLLEAIEKERIQPELPTPPPATDENAITSPPRATGSKVSSARSLASPLITTKDKKYSIKCIICNNVKNGGIREKYRISEDLSATEFLKAVKFIDDDVKIRLADIDSVERANAADIHYHNKCFRNYLSRYEKMSTICILCSSQISTKPINPININIISKILQYSREDGNTEIANKVLESFDETDDTIKKSCYAHLTCIKNYLDEDIKIIDLYRNYVQPIVNDVIAKGYGIALSD